MLSQASTVPWGARLRTATARWGGRQRAAFGEDLHVLERLRELPGPLRPVPFAGGVVRQHRVIEYQRINELRRGRGHRPRLQRAVIEIVRTAGSHGLRVGVGQFGFSHEDLARDGTHGAEFTSLARGDLKRTPEPLASGAVLTAAFTLLGG